MPYFGVRTISSGSPIRPPATWRSSTPNAKADGIGSINKVKLENQVDDVVGAFGLKNKPSADLLFNSNFLPPRGDRRI